MILKRNKAINLEFARIWVVLYVRRQMSKVQDGAANAILRHEFVCETRTQDALFSYCK